MRLSRDLFTLSELLGMHRQLAALVIRGRLYRLLREPVPCDEPEFAELFGTRRRVEGAERLSDLFVRELEAHAAQVRAHQARFLNLRPGPDRRILEDLRVRVGLHERLRFVVQRLIPRLRRLAGSHAGTVDRSAEIGQLRFRGETFEDLTSPERLPGRWVEEVLGGDALLLGQNVFHLSWIPGDQRPRDCYLQAEGERYTVQVQQRRSLMALDGVFAKRLKQAIRGNVFEAGNEFRLEQAQALEEELRRLDGVLKKGEVIYRDRERSVIWGQDGSIFCCQEAPPFVMEGADGVLRKLNRVRVGVRLSSLKPQEALPAGGAYVLEPYEHAFVYHFGGPGRLCLGHDPAFFQRFWEMPLEEGIVEYLNAARLVLCAGHFEVSDAPPYVPEKIDRHPRVSLREARAQGLPVYRYYRTGKN
jgi:hypothetical protein